MGVDINIYRARIGLFGPGHGRKNVHVVSHDSIYSPYTNTSDIHLRAFAMCMFMMVFFHVVNIVLYTYSEVHVMSSITSSIGATSDLCSETSMHDICLNHGTLSNSVDTESPTPPGFDIAQLLLMLASDVELNPGPVSNDQIMSAMEKMQSDLIFEIRSVKSDVAELKNDCSEIKSDIVFIKKKQNKMIDKIESNENNIATLNDITDRLNIDVEYISGVGASNSDKIAAIDKRLDLIETKSLSDRMRIFGLNLDLNSSLKTKKSEIIEKVLKVANNSVKWHPDDLKQVQCIASEDDKPPLVIVQFRWDDDKMCVYNGRDKLRDNGIRVGDDLSAHRRQKLKHLKDCGRQGYYYRNELVIREPETTTGSKDKSILDRIKLRGIRRTERDNVQNSPDDMEIV